MFKKILLLIAFMALPLNFSYASISLNSPAQSTSTPATGNHSQPTENATHLANLKGAKANYQTAIKTARATLASAKLSAKKGPQSNLSLALKTAQTVYKNATQTAKISLKIAVATETTRHKQVLSQNVTAAPPIQADTTSKPNPKAKIQTTGTITVKVQDGNGKPFGHPADYDILVGTDTTTVAYGSMTDSVNETSVPVGEYTLDVRSVTVNGVLYNGFATLQSTWSSSDTIKKSGDTVNYLVDYLAPGNISFQATNLADFISAGTLTKVTLIGPNGWIPQDISDSSVHTFTNAPAGPYGLDLVNNPSNQHEFPTYMGGASDLSSNGYTTFSSRCGNTFYVYNGKTETVVVKLLARPDTKPCNFNASN